MCLTDDVAEIVERDSGLAYCIHSSLRATGGPCQISSPSDYRTFPFIAIFLFTQ